MSRATLYCGNAPEILAVLPEGSVQCVVTSPPYWGLRDYATPAQVWGGGMDCQHEFAEETYHNRGGKGGQGVTSVRFGRANVGGQERLTVQAGTCRRCGAWRGHLGLEPTPALYVDHLVSLFRSVWRVLRKDGVLWLNLGDSYHNGDKGGHVRSTTDKQASNRGTVKGLTVNRLPQDGLKPKDLVGIPWRVAFALQAAGWWLRRDVIWSKPNPMPESVTDRPTSSHEYLFLLTKSERYHYDSEAISEPAGYAHEARYDPGTNGLGGGDRKTGKSTRRFKSGNLERKYRHEHGGPADNRSRQAFGVPWEGLTRNARSVWTIRTQPYAGAHFATFPEELARRCIMAGSRPGDTVLDPFGGSGTVAQVATGNGRDAIHIDLNPAYVELARQRIGPMLCGEVA